jgi:hypothetical protein
MTCRRCGSDRTVGHGANRRVCRSCGRSWTVTSARLAARVHVPGNWPGTITKDARGRLRIFLGKGHPAANSGDWQWLARFVVWRDTGRLPSRTEHVHHRDQQVENNEPDNLAVLPASDHGRLHGKAVVHLRQRDAGGRFLPMPQGLHGERRAA